MTTPIDFNGAEIQDTALAVIPNGTLARVRLSIRPGGTGPEGWLTQSRTSEALYLNTEAVILEGPVRPPPDLHPHRHQGPGGERARRGRLCQPWPGADPRHPGIGPRRADRRHLGPGAGGAHDPRLRRPQRPRAAGADRHRPRPGQSQRRGPQRHRRRARPRPRRVRPAHGRHAPRWRPPPHPRQHRPGRLRRRPPAAAAAGNAPFWAR